MSGSFRCVGRAAMAAPRSTFPLRVVGRLSMISQTRGTKGPGSRSDS